MISLKSIRERIKQWNVPKFFLNKFVFTFFLFAVWVIFFDQNNMLVQYSRFHDLNSARSKKAYYDTETIKLQAQLQQLLSDKKSVEKYAREKYYMKKPDEDVFVIVHKK